MPEYTKWLSLCLLLVLTCVTAVSAYPENYLSGKLGASVSTPAKLMGEDKTDAVLSDGPVAKGGFTFADVDQQQVFIVDLGQERMFDRVEFCTGNLGQDRNAQHMTIEASSKGPDGPFKKVFEKKGFGWRQILRLPLVKARWVRFDLGKGSSGYHVHTMRIFKGYEHPKLAEATKALASRIKPGLPGLEAFYRACQTEDWKRACKELRAYYASTQKPDAPPTPEYDLSRATNLATGKLDFAGISREEFVPIDWSYQATTDWYEHKNFLNRGAPLGIFIDAHYFTGDRKWADLARTILYDWIDANPTPEIMHRADYPTWRTLDSACRVGWLVSRFPRLTAGKNIDDELWANYLLSIWEHADYLKKDEFDGGNWLAMVSSAVMEIALQLPEFNDVNTWLAFGKSAFETNVMRDILPDGKEVEDAPGYVCMAYAGMFRTLQALDKADIPVQPEVKERMNKVLDFIGAVTQPDCTMPAIGDFSGGPIPYGQIPQCDYFKRDDIRYKITGGKEGTKPSTASVNFPQGGWSIMRSSFDESPFEDARHLVFKSSSMSHGHLDILNITAYAYGRELLIDPGIRSYEGADVERYLHTSYHNTVCIDGKSQSRGGGRTDKWVSNAGMDCVVGANNAYKGIEHKRVVLFVKPEYWIVCDRITGEGDHTCDQNWHLTEDAGITEDPVTKAVRTNHAAKGNLLMVPAVSDGLKSEVVDFFIAKELNSNDKGQVASKGWKYSRTGALPQVFDVVLYPYKGKDAPKVSVKRLDAGEGVTALEVKIGDKTDYVLCSGDGARKMSVSSAQLTVEGELAVVRTQDGKPVRVSGSNVKDVSMEGNSLFSSEQPLAEMDKSF